MRFLIDEQLPYLLADVLTSKGFKSEHVNTLGNNRGASDARTALVC